MHSDVATEADERSEGFLSVSGSLSLLRNVIREIGGVALVQFSLENTLVAGPFPYRHHDNCDGVTAEAGQRARFGHEAVDLPR